MYNGLYPGAPHVTMYYTACFVWVLRLQHKYRTRPNYNYPDVTLPHCFMGDVHQRNDYLGN